MYWLQWLSFFPLVLFAMPQTMLSQAEKIATLYSQEIARATPPSPSPLSDQCLGLASIWFTVDASNTSLNAFTTDLAWGALRELGVQAVWMQHVRAFGQWNLDPKWKIQWEVVEQICRKKNCCEKN